MEKILVKGCPVPDPFGVIGKRKRTAVEATAVSSEASATGLALGPSAPESVLNNGNTFATSTCNKLESLLTLCSLD